MSLSAARLWVNRSPLLKNYFGRAVKIDNPICPSLGAEVEARSNFFIENLKRKEYEPADITESLIHPPPFSRSFIGLYGGFLTITVGLSLATTSPLLLARLSRYHLRLSACSLLYFAGSDLASCVLARAAPWGHQTWKGGLAVGGLFLQIAAVSTLLTLDCIHAPGTWLTLPLLGVVGLHAVWVGSLWNSLPVWVKVWRGIVLTGVLASTAVMHCKIASVQGRKDQITLTEYKPAI